jgi:ABC-2 type transport system permease protein
MISLLKKELNSFFGSITGYLVIAIFLLTTSLFLWVIPGNYNIIDGQRSTLKYFFELAPWLYLFLIPAITMRMFSEEKRMGTLEILITRPISLWGITATKFIAAMLLVIISLLPTLLYYFSIYQLGNPVGNMDTGATWGSFLGLILLAFIYVALGLWASALTSNQVVSFLAAFVSSYFFYLGFEFLSSIPLGSSFQLIVSKMGIESHYQSISRGVIDSRDLFYYLFVCVILLWLTKNSIVHKGWRKGLKGKKIIFPLLLLVSVLLFSSVRIFRIDLTKEKRFSIIAISKEIIKNQHEPIVVELYLAGDLPPGMREFQEAIIEKIEDLNAYSPVNISCSIIDIYKLKSEAERNKYIKGLTESGVQPINLEHKTTEGLSTKQIFPGALVLTADKGIALNLLKNNPLLNADENLKNSIELLEFEFVSAIKSLQQKEKPTIAFLQGHGEANENETADIRYQLNENYQVKDVTVQRLLTDNSIDILLVADPSTRFEESDKLMVDQFIMKGGKVLWCVDPVYASLDSLSKRMTTLAFDRDLNLRDLLFNYGIRLNADILQDAVCIEYPVTTVAAGKSTQFVPAPFYYSPLALPNPEHPLSRNINNVLVEFPSSIEPVGESEEILKTIILATSPYGRSIQTPVEVSIMSATNPPDQKLFNTPNIPIAALLEGEFHSAFSNRLTADYGIQKEELITKSTKNKMIVIADGGIIKNKVRNRNGQQQIQPLGYDQYSGQTFGNSDFILNCIDYLADDKGIMAIRSKVIQLRMLDKVKIRDEKVKWQLINTLLPLLLLALFGIVFNIFRRKRFSK